MATLTIYANTDDGYITGADTDYATARATSTASDATDAVMWVGQESDGLNKAVYRGFARFDTTPLAGATITAVTFGVYLVALHNAEDFAVRVYRYAWASTLAGNREANYDGAYGGSATFENELWASGFAPSTGAFVTISVDPAGINTAGYTGYTLASDNDVSATEPTDTQYAEFGTVEAQDPYITVTYTPAASGGPPNALMLMGCGG